MARTSDLEGSARNLAALARLVVVKNGDRGAVACTDGTVTTSAGVPTETVDTTGAGDSFDAGFLAAWLGDEPLDRALAIANACGALSTRVIGGIGAQPTMEEARSALEVTPA
jgi:ribokinase